MVGTAAFWIVLLVGALWVGRAPGHWREGGLAALAALLIGWSDPLALLAYLGLATLVFSAVGEGRPRRPTRAVVIGLGVGLIACKFLQASITGAVAGPLGLSYLVFRLIHVTVEAGRGGAARAGSWSEFLHYVLSPATFSAGPIERWEHFSAGRLARVDGAVWGEAVQRIALGLTKKLYVADSLLAEHAAAYLGLSIPVTLEAGHSTAHCWLAAGLCYLRIYAEFSGYSDIAVGAGLLWGRRLRENFRHPLLALTPADFWRRWHVSLSQWCASYVYMPALGWWRSPALPLFGSFLVMGLWHMAGWNRVGWALYQTAGVLVHVGWSRRLGRAGNLAGGVAVAGFQLAGHAGLRGCELCICRQRRRPNVIRLAGPAGPPGWLDVGALTWKQTSKPWAISSSGRAIFARMNRCCICPRGRR